LSHLIVGRLGRRPVQALPAVDGRSLRDTAAYGERLQIIVEADVEALEEIEPPRGYGRDT